MDYSVKEFTRYQNLLAEGLEVQISCRKTLEQWVTVLQDAKRFKMSFFDKEELRYPYGNFFLDEQMKQLERKLTLIDKRMEAKENEEHDEPPEPTKPLVSDTLENNETKELLQKLREEEENKNNIVSIILPKPDWTNNIESGLESKYGEQLELLENDNVIKIRKEFNKNEDEFIESFVNYYLSKIDKYLKDYFKNETERIDKVMKDVRNIVRLEIGMKKEEKDDILKKLEIMSVDTPFSCYLYESDLLKLEEWCILEKMQLSFPDLCTREKDNYIMKLGSRIKEEIIVKLRGYAGQSAITLNFSELEVEPFGKLRDYRSDDKKPSEGDYTITTARREAYDEDTYSDYTYSKCRKNGRGNNYLRQRTLKYSMNMNVSTIALQNALRIVSQVRVSNSRDGDQRKYKKTPKRMSLLEKTKSRFEKMGLIQIG